MNILEFLFCLMFYIKTAMSSECLSPNVRTVLWHSSDLYRSCWNDNDISVLYARRLFQLILPTRIPSEIPALISHFKMCLEVISNLAPTIETHVMMMKPMADAIGGYLQSFGIPIASQEYYEGNLTYGPASQINELLKAIKKILSTDGGKWTQPINVLPSTDICPYEVIPSPPLENHCVDLITSVDLRQMGKSGTSQELCSAKIPLPFLDNNSSPKFIAVPFRKKAMYTIFEKDSTDVLLRYYTAASRCYAARCGTDDLTTPEQQNFDRSFHDWLIKIVVPHLHDGVWYPAFGGVYRLLKMLSNKGLKFSHIEETDSIQRRCLHHSPVAKTSGFFVVCVLGFLAIFWFVVLIFRRTRKTHGRIIRINEDNVITYSDGCDSTHSRDLIHAIVKSIIEDSSETSIYILSAKAAIPKKPSFPDARNHNSDASQSKECIVNYNCQNRIVE